MLDKQARNLQEQIAKAEAQIRKAQDEQKKLLSKQKALKRRARTHFICELGGALEPYLQEADLLTQADLKSILDMAFSSVSLKQQLATVLKARRDEKAKENVPMTSAE